MTDRDIVDPDELTEYQEQAIGNSRNTVFLGDRQTGKTETAIHDAYRMISMGYDTVFIAPTMRRINMVQDRMGADGNTEVVNDSRLYFESAESIDSYGNIVNGGYGFEHIIVDESTEVNPELLFGIERWSLADVNRSVLLTGTETSRTTVVELWHEHSPYWKSVSARSSDATFAPRSVWRG